MMQKIVYAKFKNNNRSAQKVRLVADLIRGKKASDAVDILLFTRKYAAKDVLKVLNSAIANAVHNEQMDKKDLMVTKVLVDNAQTYKRGRPVARGKYHQIFKRNGHITIGITDGNLVSETKQIEKQTVEVKEKADSKTKTAVKKAVKKPVAKVIKDSKTKK